VLAFSGPPVWKMPTDMEASRSDRPHGPWHICAQVLLSEGAALLKAIEPAGWLCRWQTGRWYVSHLTNPRIEQPWTGQLDRSHARGSRTSDSRALMCPRIQPGKATRTRLFKYYGLLIVVNPHASDDLFVRDLSPPPVLSFSGGVCGRCLRY
jgi:hypothetical protein